MGRLSSAELERLKQSVSLVSLLGLEGYKLHRQGKDYVMCCPFHTEKTPSFSVSVAKNCYHCFGCGVSGSVLDYVMQSQRLSMGKAIGYLQSVSGQLPTLPYSLAAPTEGNPAAVANTERQTLTDIDDDGQVLLHQVVNHYHQQLLSSDEAKAWLVKRGLTDPELLTHFKLGYAGLHGIAPVMPSKSSKAGKQMRERLEGLGVVRSSTHQDHFRGCFMVPVMGFSESACVAQRGKVLQLYGRRTQPDYKIIKGNPKHLYLPSPLVGVWNESCLVGSDTVILCEALIDAMTIWCAGYRNVISSYGVNGFTDDHLVALQHHQVKTVYIAYDRDDAGDNAADKLAGMLTEHGITCYRVIFPKGMDANDFLVASGNPKKSLDLLLEQAQLLNVVASVNAGINVLGSGVDKVSEDIPYQTLPNGELLLTFGSREWRLKGVEKNLSATSMKIHAQVRDNNNGAFHVDQLELYQAKARSLFIRQACGELALDESVIKRDLGRILLLLERLQDKAIQDSINGSVNHGCGGVVELDTEQQASALELLRSPDLISRIADDLASCGVVGERNNLLAGYLAAVSRKLDKPLAVLIQSSSAAGKSSLMDAVLSLIPEEERVQYSAMTGQSLFYLGETNLQHKILAIAEEEGVRQAAYALKLLQSDGELTIASTGKDEKSGSLVTKQYTVKGPVMLMLTTTAIDVDEELLNRCLVLSVNESEAQTKAIHALQRQRQTLEGLLAESEKQYLTELHQNGQRLLKPLKVVNPYANELTFLSDKTRTRRDHMKYLTLIQSITLLHQYQREIKRVEHRGKLIEYIEVTLDDIQLANELAHAILGRTLDEMPPQTRKLLNLLKDWVKAESERQCIKPYEYHFSRREVRAYTHWGDTQLKIHLGRLVEMEYLSLYRKGLSYEYSLLYDGEDNGDNQQRHLCGLLAVEQLKQPRQTDDKAPSDKTDNKVNDNKITPVDDAGKTKRSGQTKKRSVTGRGKVGGQSVNDNTAQSQSVSDVDDKAVGEDNNAIIRTKPKKRKTSPPVANQGNFKEHHQQVTSHGQ